MALRCIELCDGTVRLIDQTLLPTTVAYIETTDWETIAEAIRMLRVRGAPAIGIAGAFGLVVGSNAFSGEDEAAFWQHLRHVSAALAATRPTAKNLFWAQERMLAAAEERRGLGVRAIQERLTDEAQAIWTEDSAISERLSDIGATLIKDSSTVLTHCNTGRLVTAGPGTALGVIYAAVRNGKRVRVYADETRPLLQGARLTAWELQQEGIDVTLICDSAAGMVMRQGLIDCVIVGADRIASNGDVANKIGTYSVAVQAEKHGVPFYVAAPYSTFDFGIASGADIPIEERAADEVSAGFGLRTAPAGVTVYNPAFDITPASLVTAIITEAGIFYPPYGNWGALKKP